MQTFGVTMVTVETPVNQTVTLGESGQVTSMMCVHVHAL